MVETISTQVEKVVEASGTTPVWKAQGSGHPQE